MKLSRRKLLQMAAVSAPLLPHVALAMEYPARPVRMVLGLSPGGSVDMVTRIVAQALSEFLGQPFVIENKPGAAGDIATEAVVRATPDGYTLLVVLAANAINATLHQKLKFSPVRDLAMVAGHGARAQCHGGEPGGAGRIPFPSSSPMPKPIPASSAMRPAAPAARST